MLIHIDKYNRHHPCLACSLVPLPYSLPHSLATSSSISSYQASINNLLKVTNSYCKRLYFTITVKNIKIFIGVSQRILTEVSSNIFSSIYTVKCHFIILVSLSTFFSKIKKTFWYKIVFNSRNLNRSRLLRFEPGSPWLQGRGASQYA